MTEPIDVAAMRACANDLADSPYNSPLRQLARDVLRVLDAFDAMRQRDWALEYSSNEDAWIVWDSASHEVVALGDTPITALLSAAEKGVTDAKPS